MAEPESIILITCDNHMFSQYCTKPHIFNTTKQTRQHPLVINISTKFHQKNIFIELFIEPSWFDVMRKTNGPWWPSSPHATTAFFSKNICLRYATIIAYNRPIYIVQIQPVYFMLLEKKDRKEKNLKKYTRPSWIEARARSSRIRKWWCNF